MERVVSDVAGYAHKVIHDSGDVTYFNEIRMTDELSRVMSMCWDSLSVETQKDINERAKKRQEIR
jgi:hypothetical protein